MSKCLVNKINYMEVGRGMLEETIGFNTDIYEHVNVNDYSDEIIFKMAEKFINNYPKATLDYLAWCMAMIDDCAGETYSAMFDIVREATLNTKQYYWNDWEEQFYPMKKLISAVSVVTNMRENIIWNVKNDLGTYINIELVNGKHVKLITTNTKFVLRDDNENIACLDTEEELLAEIKKLNKENALRENIKFDTIIEFNLPEKDIVEGEYNTMVLTNGVDCIDVSTKECVFIHESDVDWQNGESIKLKSLREFYGYSIVRKLPIEQDRVIREGCLFGGNSDFLIDDNLNGRYITTINTKKDRNQYGTACKGERPAEDFYVVHNHSDDDDGICV